MEKRKKGGKNKETKIVEDYSKLETQFILRLPPEHADKIKTILKTKPKKIKKVLKICMDPETRKGEVTVSKHTVPIKLVDLPTIVESMKSIDKKIFFKTANIHQMYIAYEPEENNNVESDSKKTEKQYMWPHGITPPLKNVAKSRFRKTMKNNQPLDGSDIEKEVKWLLKMDNEAIAVRWELIDDDQVYNNKQDSLNASGADDSDPLEILDEREVFGDMSESVSEDEFHELLHEFEEMQANGTLSEITSSLHAI